MNVPWLTQPDFKPGDQLPPVLNRWAAEVVQKLNQWWTIGTDRIWGFAITRPGSQYNGLAMIWNEATKTFIFGSSGSLNPVITPGGPIGGSTQIPVITWNQYGQLTVVGAATIAGLPTPARRGQWLASEDGATFSTLQYDNVLDIPPGSPSANDDEFSATTLGGIWTADSGVVSGLVDLNTAVGSGAIYDLTSFPGAIKIQPVISGGFLGIKQDVSTAYASNDVTVWVKFMLGYAGGPNLPQMSLLITDNAGTAFVRVGVEQFVSTNRVGAVCFDSFPTNSGFQINGTNGLVQMPIYLGLRRVKTGSAVAWTAAASVGGYSWSRLSSGIVSSLTFTPKWAAIRANIASGTTAVGGCCFFRMNNDTRWPGGG